jgi:ATP-dependent DNA helicase RecG
MYAAEVDPILALPPDERVARLIAVPEGQWFERKSGAIRPRDLAVALVAFANAEGGTIVIGLSDGQADGVDSRRVNDLRQAPFDFTEPAVRTTVEEWALPGKAGRGLLVVRVEPGERVHQTTAGDCYLRVGDESRRLTFAQRQELEYDRGSTPFDGTAAGVDIRDLEPRQVRAYQDAIGASTPEAMLRARSLLTRDGRVTVAGYLLFAEHPQDLLPHAHVRVLRYAGTERGTGSGLTLEEGADVRCEGSIPEQIARATQAVERLIPRRSALGATGRFEPTEIVPRDAWLEGLVNAVLHRSYSMVGDHVRVEVFPDRLEITSPGRFPGLVDPDAPLMITRQARNPRIARVCSDLGIARELGEGIRRIFDEMRGRGLVDPMYVQTASTVRLVLSAADSVPPEVRAALPRGALRVLDVLRQARRPLGTGQIEELVGITRPTAIRHLRALREAGLVVWSGQSPRDPRAVWRLS